MDKRYKITALCGMGLGTSSLARMAIMDYVKSHGIDATVTVADIGSVKSIDADIILTTKSMASHITDDIRSRTTVMYVTNLIKKDEINVEIADGYLTIQASKGLDKDQQDKDGKYIRQERYAGSCSRSFYIGEDVPAEDISAKYEDGILRLSVPKADQKELPKTSTIAIE